MQPPNDDRVLILFVCFFGAFFLALFITLSLLSMSGSIGFVVYFAACLFLFSVGLMVYTHLHGKKFINETLDQMTDLFSSGVSHIEAIGMLSATPLVTPFGRITLGDVWSAQPLALRNAGSNAALNVSVIVTDGEQVLASRGTSVIVAHEKEKIMLLPARLIPHFPDTVDGLPLLAPAQSRALVFYQDVLGMAYLSVFGAEKQHWAFLGSVRKTTLTFDELLVA